MNEKILIVEDNPVTIAFLRATLELENLDVRATDNGDDALAQIRSDPPDLILLDIVLPGMSGFDICRAVRQDNAYIPIIMLTGQTADEDKVAGLEMGADDYITKPFGARELIARVHAVLRRTRLASGRPIGELVQVGSLIIDRRRRVVTCDEQVIELTRKEFDLLLTLASEPERVFERDELLKLVWEYEYPGKSRTVDVHIQQLRSKIEPDPAHPRYLLTVHGIGYKFVAREDV